MSKNETLPYKTIAEKAGIELSAVDPQSHQHRIEKLETIVADNDVPYPIPEQLRQPYLAAARSGDCLLYTSPSPRDRTRSRMPSSA